MSTDDQKESKIVDHAIDESHLSFRNTIEEEIFHEISHDGSQGDAPQITAKVVEQDFALEEVYEEQHITSDSLPKPAHSDQLESLTVRIIRVRCAPERYGSKYSNEQASTLR